NCIKSNQRLLNMFFSMGSCGNQANKHCAFRYDRIGYSAYKYTMVFAELTHDELTQICTTLCQYRRYGAFGREYIVSNFTKPIAQCVGILPQLFSPFRMAPD